ncbi:site-specific integrase [Nocardia farcinica]|uniref:tyrosine-type recombinase/integrase n=1 Tax=Nocardia farcinica TaxID=37329 RepID=UPI00189544BE|nr:site-specific integrase [Nocardia farcinica]MBF6420854.1 site-specific integrase [Nocardia farcinica]MBF6432687.1 site-specific integrase [Nocardia farcinica]MBF6503186.1 site-specific integrase [Nocardia farcinica]
MTIRRNRRAGVEDLWTKDERQPDGTVKRVPSKLHGKGKRWRGRYVDDLGNEHTKRFARKVDAQAWLDSQVATLVEGTHISPRDAQLTVSEWCAIWLKGYSRNRKTTVDLAKQHVNQINAEFGDYTLGQIRPSMVKAWVARLKADGLAESTIYALHTRLSQILGDAVEDKVLARNPCSRRTSPPAGRQKVYIATTEQIWALHDALPEHLQVAVLLGAFAGLRISEVCQLKVADVDFVRGVVHPKQQWKDQPLKTDASNAPIPIPHEMSLMLSASVKTFPGEHIVCDMLGKPVSPWTLSLHVRQAREAAGARLPDEFTFHDLRHYYASLLISKGADIKTVQARMRHGSAMTTLKYYAHLWPDADESTRTAIGGVLKSRIEATAYPLRTAHGGAVAHTPESSSISAVQPL